MAVAELCRWHDVSEQSFYRWKAKYGGMDIPEAKRLRQLEEENSRLNGSSPSRRRTSCC